ncbi:hypothetical protein Nmel_009794 [Mimus melanotis]
MRSPWARSLSQADIVLLYD